MTRAVRRGRVLAAADDRRFQLARIDALPGYCRVTRVAFTRGCLAIAIGAFAGYALGAPSWAEVPLLAAAATAAVDPIMISAVFRRRERRLPETARRIHALPGGGSVARA